MTAVKTVRVSLPHRSTKSDATATVPGTEMTLDGIDAVISAIGNKCAAPLLEY